jgi:hypothetical protein
MLSFFAVKLCLVSAFGTKLSIRADRFRHDRRHSRARLYTTATVAPTRRFIDRQIMFGICCIRGRFCRRRFRDKQRGSDSECLRSVKESEIFKKGLTSNEVKPFLKIFWIYRNKTDENVLQLLFKYLFKKTAARITSKIKSNLKILSRSEINGCFCHLQMLFAQKE